MSQTGNALVTAALPGRRSGMRSEALPGIAAMWHETLHLLSAHSAPILACALFGLVGASLLGALVNVALTFDAYLRLDGIFPTYANTFYAQLLAQAAVGTFAISLARGAITWIALQSNTPSPITLHAALQAGIQRWPALLLSSLIYGSLITLGIAGLTLLLRQARLDVTSIGRVNADFDSIARVIGVRVVNGFIADPGSPFTEMVGYARYLLRRSSTNYYWLYAYRYSLGDVPLRVWLIALASLLPLIAGGTFLRFRAAAVMNAARPNQWESLFDGLQLGGRYFAYVFRNGAVVWLVSSATTIVFVTLPMSLVQYLAVPALSRALNTLWPYPASTFLFAVGTALIGMLFSAFATVYDARLYMRLKQAGQNEQP